MLLSYDDRMIAPLLPEKLRQVRARLSDQATIEVLIQRTALALMQEDCPATENEALTALRTTSGGIWQIIDEVHVAILYRCFDANIDGLIGLDRQKDYHYYLPAVPLNSPRHVAAYYLAMRSAVMLTAAARAVFKDYPQCKATTQALNELIEALTEQEMEAKS